MKIDPAEIRRRNFITRVPVRDAGRADLRHRRLRRRTSTRRSSSPTSPASPARKARVEGEGQAARPRLLLLHRGVRPRAVEHRRRARRARRPVRGRRGARASDRHRHRLHRLAQPRPGPRDDLRAGGRRPARHPDRERRDRPRRHRPHPVRHGHLRQPLARGRRHGDRQGARQDRSPRARRSPRTCWRRPTPTSSSRTASSRSPAPTRTMPFGNVSLTAYVPHNYPARQARAGPERERVLRSDQLHLSGRHATSARSRSIRTPA